jgi:hypothetical protein
MLKPEQLTLPMSALEEIERRAIVVNMRLIQMRDAIERRDLQTIAELRAAAQEDNWTNRRTLLAIGVPDSLHPPVLSG